jgi:hypothetical protein
MIKHAADIRSQGSTFATETRHGGTETHQRATSKGEEAGAATAMHEAVSRSSKIKKNQNDALVSKDNEGVPMQIQGYRTNKKGSR